jgi:hypothetical protein
MQRRHYPPRRRANQVHPELAVELDPKPGKAYLSASSIAPGSSRLGASESFRESQTPGRGTIPALSEEEFQSQQFESDTLDLQQSDPRDSTHTETQAQTRTRASPDLQTSTGPWKGKQRAHDPAQQEYSSAWERAYPQSQAPAQPPVRASYEPNANDGLEVVSLLSDSTFDPNTDPYNPEYDIDASAEPAPLTPDEIKALESFRRSFSSESQMQGDIQQGRGTGAGISDMSLIPDIDTFLAQDTFGSGSGSMALRDSVLENLPGAGDWMGVQERYHDEVWGYLRPALEAAKSEMEENRNVEGQGHSEGPAVRRLRMILKHMG